MGGLEDIAVRVVSTTGVAGAIVIALLVAGILGVILFARTANLFQQSDFQSKLLAAVDRLTKVEESLRAEVETLQNDKEQLQRALSEATVAIELMRAQQRRLIDLFRDVLAGKRTVASIEASELGS
jgi:uncharacterized protein YlxW (UPF0749 family)